MHMLADNNGCNRVSVLGLVDQSLVLELGSLRSETRLNILSVAVLKVLVLNANEVVGVHLGRNLTVCHWLDGGVEVVLVDLLVDGSGDLLVLRW